MPNIRVHVRVKERKHHKPRTGVVISTDPEQPDKKNKWLVLFEKDDTPVPRSSQQLLYVGEEEPPTIDSISDDASDSFPFPTRDDGSLVDDESESHDSGIENSVDESSNGSSFLEDSIDNKEKDVDDEAIDTLEDEEDVIEYNENDEKNDQDEQNPFVPSSSALESTDVHKEKFQNYLNDKDRMIKDGLSFEVKCGRPTKIMEGDKVMWVSAIIS